MSHVTYSALTIQQPWAEAIASGEKIVENRTWKTSYRGPLLIHAGRGAKYLRPHYNGLLPPYEPDELAFGAVIAIAELVACVTLADLEQGNVPDTCAKHIGHPWAEGPFCWLLADVRRLREPIPCGGKQGLWKISLPVNAIAAVNSTARGRKLPVL